MMKESAVHTHRGEDSSLAATSSKREITTIRTRSQQTPIPKMCSADHSAANLFVLKFVVRRCVFGEEKQTKTRFLLDANIATSSVT